jgi:hypothetical protein
MRASVAATFVVFLSLALTAPMSAGPDAKKSLRSVANIARLAIDPSGCNPANVDPENRQMGQWAFGPPPAGYFDGGTPNQKMLVRAWHYGWALRTGSDELSTIRNALLDLINKQQANVNPIGHYATGLNGTEELTSSHYQLWSAPMAAAYLYAIANGGTLNPSSESSTPETAVRDAVRRWWADEKVLYDRIHTDGKIDAPGARFDTTKQFGTNPLRDDIYRLLKGVAPKKIRDCKADKYYTSSFVMQELKKPGLGVAPLGQPVAGQSPSPRLWDTLCVYRNRLANGNPGTEWTLYFPTMTNVTEPLYWVEFRLDVADGKLKKNYAGLPAQNRPVGKPRSYPPGSFLDPIPGVVDTAQCPLPESLDQGTAKVATGAIATPADFDGDDVSEIVLHTSGTWQWFTTAGLERAVWTGTGPGCVPAPADYDGDGYTDLSLYCNGAWHFYNDDGTYLKGIWTGGAAGSLPVPADYDGDGRADVVFFQDGTWHFFDFTTGAYIRGLWTGPGSSSIPLPIDHDGDGRANLSVYQNGAWHFFNDNGTYLKGIWTGAVAGDVPVPGDYDRDGREEPVIFRGGSWQFYDFASGAFTHGVWTGATPPFHPAPLDIDGDGSLNLTIFETSGAWHFYNDDGSYRFGVWTAGNSASQPISRRQGTPPTPPPPQQSVNLATGKPTTQSSIFCGSFCHPSQLAVDDNTDGNVFNGSVTHTGLDYQASWQVDLGSVSAIEQIKVWNRTDCCADRLSNFYALVSDVPFSSTDLSATIFQQGVSSYYVAGQGGRPSVIAVGRSGRYVRVQLAATNYLSLAEVQIFGQAGTSSPETIWIEDTTPAGAVLQTEGGDAWAWISSSPTPYSGSLAHRSNIVSGRHQHFFAGATETLHVPAGTVLFAYVYLDPLNPPSEVMLQWNDGWSWEHRAYWGADQIDWGTNGAMSRRYMGPLPSAGQWVRLEVPASVVGLEGQTLNGMAFTLFGGRATWDRAGKRP